MDRLEEENAVIEELVDVVVVDVRTVADDLMALKMRLLVVDAVVRLIEEDMDMDVGVDMDVSVGMGVVELVTLIGSGLLVLLKMVTTTTNSLLFWTFRIKWLEASYVSGFAEGCVQRPPEGEARNISLLPTIAAIGQELAVRFSDTAISNLISNSTIARHLQNQLITTKIAGKDSDERNRPNIIERRFQYATWLVNLGQYSHLPVPFFTGVHRRQVHIDELGFKHLYSENQRLCTISAIKQHLVLPHIQAEILNTLEILETCGQRLVSISSSGEPTCCLELGTTHFSKLHNRNVRTGARVFIAISLHLTIEKSHFINVNKYIVIVNEHFII